MTEGNRLGELASRCEAATGPDRALDNVIANTICLPLLKGDPAYTASLDAAMTLVPEGWDVIRIERTRLSDDIGAVGYKAEIMEIGPDAQGFMRAEARTRPLALAAAALRARGEGSLHG